MFSRGGAVAKSVKNKAKEFSKIKVQAKPYAGDWQRQTEGRGSVTEYGETSATRNASDPVQLAPEDGVRMVFGRPRIEMVMLSTSRLVRLSKLKFQLL